MWQRETEAGASSCDNWVPRRPGWSKLQSRSAGPCARPPPRHLTSWLLQTHFMILLRFSQVCLLP